MPTEFGTSAHPLFCCGVRRKIEDAPPKPRRKTWPCARRQPNEEENSVRQRFLDDTADAAARHADAAVTVHNPTASYGATLSSDAAAAAQQASTTAAAALLTATADVESVSPAVAALPGVHIRGLHKVFYGNDGARAAVDNLSIDMYDGQVTCLLGHNGTPSSRAHAPTRSASYNDTRTTYQCVYA
ncbi:hypothetical protein EON62_05095 [archaeon]|nr:MAG: hypothetical protein EON62_05095 [archaeon]